MSPGASQLIDRCTNGDARAWSELVSRYRLDILRVLVRSAGAGSPEEVCDLEQDVWARVLVRDRAALRGLRDREDGAVRAFLCTVALNVARDARRRAGVRPGPADPSLLDGLLDDPDNDPELLAVDRERRNRILEVAREEVREDRDLLIFQLYYRDGASAREIAAFPGVGLTPKGVETVIHRLTVRVRQRLGNEA